MQAHSEPSTAPHFVQGNKVTIVAKNLFLRGQPNRKLRDRQLGSLSVDEHIRKHIYILKLPATTRLHPVLHVNNFKPYYASSLRCVVPVAVPKGDDDEFGVFLVFVVCIKSLLPGHRGKYVLFMTHFNDNDIPQVW
jgi:hypothetical protein